MYIEINYYESTNQYNFDIECELFAGKMSESWYPVGASGVDYGYNYSQETAPSYTTYSEPVSFLTFFDASPAHTMSNFVHVSINVLHWHSFVCCHSASPLAAVHGPEFGVRHRIRFLDPPFSQFCT